MTGSVCKNKDNIYKHNKSVADRIAAKIGDHKKDIYDKSSAAQEKIRKVKEDTKASFDQSKKKLTGMYLNQGWRKKRPDVTFLIELTVVIVLGVILWYTWPYLTGSAKPGFSQAQFTRATKIPESAFTVSELAKVNLEVKSLQDYSSFFKGDPYSLANNGIYDLMVSVAILPFIMFFMQFVLPPFVIAYVIWFLMRFWPHVLNAAWGWFKMLLRYFTLLIQGRMGCKWYIRMVTGWHCRSPRFSSYFNAWRRRYVDRPVYHQKLSYIKKYYWAKQTYYTDPLRKYVSLPYRRYKVKATYTKRLYVDRVVEVFLKKVRDSYPEYYTMPRDEFYRWLLGNDKKVAKAYASALRVKEQAIGGPYDSVTRRGKKCTCPGADTPISKVHSGLSEQIGHAKNDIDKLVDTTNQVYDTVAKVKEASQPDCGKVDKVIHHRRSIAGVVILSIIGMIIGMYGFSSYFGTPTWLKHIVTPTSKTVMRGMQLITTGKSYWSLPLIYLSVVSTVAMVIIAT